MFGSIIQKVVDAILPLGDEVGIARSASEDVLTRLLQPISHPDNPWIIALFPYRNKTVRAVVKAMKYRGETTPLPVVGRMMADEILDTLGDKESLEGWGKPLLVPIPNSRERMRSRGYNQTERIARAMLPHLEGRIIYDASVLGRDERASQVSVARDMRSKNIVKSFFVPEAKKVRGAHIILIDDVTETGATLHDAKRALLFAGAKDVIAFAVAH